LEPKKVLILAYDFPPYVSVGSLRPYNWFKYLNEFDVYPVVVTRQWENKHGNLLDYVSASVQKEVVEETLSSGKIIRAPYFPNLSNRILLRYGGKRFKVGRKLITAYYEFIQYLFNSGPKVELYKAARVFLMDNKVDVIVASGEPFVLFKYASQLSKEFDIPWIADYRDPWSLNKDNDKNIVFKLWYRLFEKKIVKTASKIITVSEFLKVGIRGLISDVPIHILPNGYDPEVIDNAAKTPQSSDFLQIAFVGTIYDWHPIESFLKVFHQFVNQRTHVNIKLNLYGINKRTEIEELIQEKFPELKNHIEIFSRISNDLLLKELAKNNVMLLFNYYSFMGTKIFDYIGIRRRILMCYSNDIDALKLKEKYYTMEEIDGVSHHLQVDLIEETNSGVVVENESCLLPVLNQLYEEFEVNKKIECNSIGVENYSRKIQVKKLAEVIKKM
jgi:glycosyltransferase involved in cell wall biosynthesis